MTNTEPMDHTMTTQPDPRRFDVCEIFVDVRGNAPPYHNPLLENHTLTECNNYLRGDGFMVGCDLTVYVRRDNDDDGNECYVAVPHDKSPYVVRYTHNPTNG